MGLLERCVQIFRLQKGSIQRQVLRQSLWFSQYMIVSQKPQSHFNWQFIHSSDVTFWLCVALMSPRGPTTFTVHHVCHEYLEPFLKTLYHIFPSFYIKAPIFIFLSACFFSSILCGTSAVLHMSSRPLASHPDFAGFSLHRPWMSTEVVWSTSLSSSPIDGSVASAVVWIN